MKPASMKIEFGNLSFKHRLKTIWLVLTGGSTTYAITVKTIKDPEGIFTEGGN
jgi:hypothetical protein